MWRVKQKLKGLTTIKRILINSWKANATARIRRTKPNDKEREKTRQCHKCGGPNHFAKKCRTLQHLVELYQKSLKEVNEAKKLYEAHFNDVSKVATTSETKVEDPKIPRMTNKEDMDLENTIIKYNSNDVFGYLN
jgi:hypothetical protein